MSNVLKKYVNLGKKYTIKLWRIFKANTQKLVPCQGKGGPGGHRDQRVCSSIKNLWHGLHAIPHTKKQWLAFVKYLGQLLLSIPHTKKDIAIFVRHIWKAIRSLPHTRKELITSAKRLWHRLHSLSHRQLLTITVVLGIFIVILIKFPQFFRPRAAWFNDQWSYRISVPINNPNNSNLTNFQVKVTLNTAALISAGKMQLSGNDIRFTNQNGLLLPYWIETGTDGIGTTGTALWVKIDSVPISGTTLYLYYGNPSAAPFSNGNSTFNFFDDFSTADNSKFYYNYPFDNYQPVNYSIVPDPAINGNKLLQESSDGTWRVLASKYIFAPNSNGIIGTRYQMDVGTSNSYHIALADTNSPDQNRYGLANPQSSAAGEMDVDQIVNFIGSTVPNAFTFSPNTWYKTEITKVALDTVKIKTFGADWSSLLNTTSTQQVNWLATSWNWINEIQTPNTNTYLDWFYIRQYAPSDLTVGALGSEQTATTPIAYWSFNEARGTTVHNQVESNGEKGLLSWWKFDESVGNTIHDDTGIAPGTLGPGTSAPTWTTGHSGTALSFNGSSNYVNLSNPAALQLSSSVTLSAWVNFSTVAVNNQTIMGKRDVSGSASANYALRTGTGANQNQLEFYFYNGGWQVYTTSNANLAANTWYQVAATYDGANVNVYLNGVLLTGSCSVGSCNVPLVPDNNNFSIGRPGDYSAEFFNGVIDSVKVYNRVLAAGEISADFHSYQGNIIDLNPADNGSSWPAGAAADVFQSPMGHSLFFNGYSNYVDVGNTITNIKTLTFWINPISTGTTIMDFDGGTHYLVLSGGTLAAVGFSSPAYYVNGITTRVLTSNIWQHVVVTTSTPFTAAHLLIGKSKNAAVNLYFNGTIDEMRLYNYSFSGPQVALDHNRNAATVLGGLNANPSNPGANGLSAWWKFDENSARSVFDSSGNNNNGTVFGAPVWVPGKFGSAINLGTTTVNNIGITNATLVNDSLVAYWQFNEGTGTSVTDITGNNHTLTFDSGSSAPTWDLNSRFGTGIKSNGNDDLNILNFSETSTSYTFSFWVNSTATGTDNRLLDSHTGRIIIAYDSNVSGKLGYYDNSAAWTSSSVNAPNDGQWHNLVWTMDAGTTTVSIYIDGSLAQTGLKYTPSTLGGQSDLGAGYNGSGGAFAWTMDEIRIYSRVLSPTEVLTNYQAYNPTYSNGTANYVSVPSSLGVAPTAAYTVEGWIKPSSSFNFFSDNNQGILDKGDYQFYLDRTDGKAKWTVNDSTANSFSPLTSGLSSNAVSMTTYNGKLVVGGYFSTAGGVSTQGLAVWDGSSWSNIGIGGSVTQDVDTMAVYKGNLYVGGIFTKAGNVGCSNVAMWNGTSWSPLGSGVNSNVQSMTVWNGNLYVGGEFTKAGGATVSYLAMWDGANWHDVDGGVSNWAESMTVFNNNLVVGGLFQTAGSQDIGASGIAAWDGTSWHGLGGGFNGFPTVTTLAVYNGNLYAGGSFTKAGGVDASNVAMWDGSFWHSVGSGTAGGSGNGVMSMAVLNGNLYAGGDFTTAGGVGANAIARWNGSSWSALGVGVSSSSFAYPLVNTMAVWNGNLYAGGIFDTAGGASANDIVQYGTNNGKTISSTTADWSANQWYHFASTYDGTAMKLYINGQLENTFATSLTLGSQGKALQLGSDYGSRYAGDGGENFNGTLDNFKIYNRALSLSEITYEYTQGGPAAYYSFNEGTGSTAFNSSATNLNPTGLVSDSLLAYWKLDEGVGTNSVDSSGNGHLLTFGPGTSSPVWITGKFSIGISSQGNSYSTINSLTDSSTSYTFSYWVNSTAAASTGKYLFDDQTGRLITAWNANSSGKLGFYDSNTTWVNSAVSAPNDGSWHNLVFVLNSGTTEGSIYIDGVLADNGLLYTPTSISGTAAIGGHYNGAGNNYDGALDEIRIYDRPLSATEIANNYLYYSNFFPAPATSNGTINGNAFWSEGAHLPNQKPLGKSLSLNVQNPYAAGVAVTLAAFPANLVDYWQLDEGAGSTTPIDSGSNHDSLTIGSGASAPVWTSGIIGSALSYSYTNQYARVVSAPGIPSSGAFTLSAWVNPSYIGIDGVIAGRFGFASSGNCAYGYDIEITPAGTAGIRIDPSGCSNSAVVNSATILNSKTWYYVTGTWDGTTAKIYINGHLENSHTESAYSAYPNFYIGNDYSNYSNSYVDAFEGTIDEVQVYSRTLSASEVSSNYQNYTNYIGYLANPNPGAAIGYVDVPNSSSLSPSTSVSSTGWFKLSQNFNQQSNNNMGIFDKGDYQFYLDRSDGKAKWVVNDNTSQALSALGGSVNGAVTALTVYNGDLYALGSFTTAGGVLVNHIAYWDGTSWYPLCNGTCTGTTDGINSSPYAFIVYNSKLYVGGGFTTAGGVGVSGIAQWDGSSWSAPTGGGVGGTPRIINALTVWNSQLVAGGQFQSAGGVGTSNLAVWNGSSWSALGTGTNSQIRALAADNNNNYLYVGGGFTKVSGIGATAIARYDTTNGWTPIGGIVTGVIYALATDNSSSYNNLYVGGAFSSINGIGASNAAMYNPLGGWSRLSYSGLQYTVKVNSIYAVGNTMYFGGSFTYAGGSTMSNIAMWNGNRWNPLGKGVGTTVSAITQWNGNIYAGGSFTTAGGNASYKYLAYYDGTSWNYPTTSINGTTYALTVLGGNLYVGGNFTTADGVGISDVTMWNGSSWSALGSGINGPVKTLAAYNGNLYAGGTFQIAGGVGVSNVAMWDGSSWSPLDIGIGRSSGTVQVNCSAVYNGNLIVGGYFSTAGGVGTSNIAMWNGSSWSALGSGTNGTVTALAVYNGNLYVGGQFTSAGGISVGYLAMWDGSAWHDVSGGTNSTVTALADYNGQLIVGGGFNSAGGISVSNLAAWNGSAWSSFNGGANSTVYALSVWNGDLAAGGAFSSVNGVGVSKVALWNGSSWSSPGPGIDNTVYALASWDSSLYLGGSFTNYLDSFGSPNATSVSSNTSYWTANQWYHYATVFDGSNLSLYINGRFENSIAAPDSLSTQGLDLLLGKTYGSQYAGDSDDPLQGNLDEMRFFNYAITPAQIAVDYNRNSAAALGVGAAPNNPNTTVGTTTSITALYKFDERNGSVVSDSSGYQNNGSWSGTPVWVPGKFGSALGFDGVTSGNNAVIPSAIGIAPTAAYTVEGWFKPSSLFNNQSNSNQSILDKGDYQFYLDQSDGKARWSVNDSTSNTFSSLGTGITSGGIYGLNSYNGNLFASGIFTSISGLGTSNIAMWNGSSWSAVGGGLSIGAQAATVYDGNYIYGNGEYSWNGANWTSINNTPGGWVIGYATYQGNLYSIGNFTTNDGVGSTGIEMWDGSNFHSVGTGFSGGWAGALAVYNNLLYVGGNFTKASGVGVSGIATWNGSSWSNLSQGIGATGNIASFAVYNGNLYAGGSFTKAGGIGVSNIAIWNGSTWSSLGSGTNGPIDTLTVFDGNLYAGGSFTSAGGVGTSNIAVWNGSSWSGVSGSTNNQVLTSAVYNGNLYFGGAFTTIAGISSRGIVKYGTSNTKIIPSATTTWLPNQWYHFASTYDGTTMKLYINGRLENSVTSSLTLASQGLNLLLGSSYGSQYQGDGGEVLNGAIDNLKFYNRPLTPAEITYEYNGSTSLSPVASWRFDEKNGAVAHDDAKLAVTQNLISANPSFEGPTTWSTDANTYINNSSDYSYSGNYSGKIIDVADGNDYATYTTASPISPNTAYTLSAWVYLPAINGSPGLNYSLDLLDATNGLGSSAPFSAVATGVWTHLSTTLTTGSSVPASLETRLSAYNSSTPIYYDGVQLEKSAAATNFCDGSLVGAGNSWIGAPYASTSVCHNALDGNLAAGSSAPTWTSGRFGNALSFSGSQYVDVPNNSSYAMGTGDYSVDAWFNTAGTGTTQTIINSRGNDDWILGISGSKLQFYLNDSATGHTATINGGTILKANTWYYVAVTLSRTGNATIYLNGSPDGVGDITGVPDNISPTGVLRIGWNSTGISGVWGSAFFNGLIDEVKIYNLALTPSQIDLDMNHGQAVRLTH